MWYYSQTSGAIQHGDLDVAKAYSGNGLGKNNPAMQNVHNVGPIPAGLYQMGDPIEQHPTLGHYVIPLAPSMDNQMMSRSGFYIHGDNLAHIGDSSDGCIVCNLNTRMEMWNSADYELTVTS